MIQNVLNVPPVTEHIYDDNNNNNNNNNDIKDKSHNLLQSARARFSFTILKHRF